MEHRHPFRLGGRTAPFTHHSRALRPASRPAKADFISFTGRGLTNVLSYAYPDDVGTCLLATCTALRDDEEVRRAVLLRSTHASAIFRACLNNSNAERFRYVCSIAAGRRSFDRCGEQEQFAAELAWSSNKYEAITILAEHKFSVTGQFSTGHSLFSHLCTEGRSLPAASSAALHVASVRAADGTFVALGQGGGWADSCDGDTGLYRACEAGLHDVVRLWCSASPAAVAALLHTPCEEERGHTPFTIACYSAGHKDSTATQRAGAAACATLLVSLPGCHPTLTGAEGSYLYWACFAGLVDVVRRWMQDERVTEQWLRTPYKGSGQSSVWHDVLSALRTKRFAPAVELSLRQCVELVCLTGPVHMPVVGEGNDYLSAACIAGLDKVLAHWLKHDLADVRAHVNVQLRNDSGHTPMSVACKVSALQDKSVASPAVRLGARACALQLYKLPECDPTFEGGDCASYLLWAAAAGLEEVVSAWLKHPSVTPAWLARDMRMDVPGGQLLSTLCWAWESRPFQHGSVAEAVSRCIELIGTSGKCSPSVMNRAGESALYWVCEVGQVAVLRYWLQYDRAGVLQAVNVREQHGRKHTPFTVACQAARQKNSPGARECALLLASLPACTARTIGGDDETYRYWAESASITLV